MITAVVPVRNELNYTKFIVQDIEKKCKLVDELIIIDDNSTDGTKERLSQNKYNFNIMGFDYDIGVNQGWNLGVDQAKNDYVLILNNDIILTDGIDEAMMGLIDKKGAKIANACYTQGPVPFHVPVMLKQNNICGHCFMVKKSGNLFPIPKELDIWFGDDYLYNKAGQDYVLREDEKICHHFVSKTLKTPEQQENIWNRIDNDKIERHKIKILNGR